MNDVDTSGTISMEEEIQEGYEPTPQEIADYALHLGMDLTIDARYLDIARAGLKAPLPVEWRPCQKNKNGQQDFFYKNVQTGAVSYDHPCDLIFRKKFQDAKNLDSKGTQKKSGMNKFKQAVEMQRDGDVLGEQQHLIQAASKVVAGGMRALEFGNDIEEDRSFMIESNINTRNRNPNQYEPEPPTKLSTLQQSTAMQEQINAEYAQSLKDYERHQLTTLVTIKEQHQHKQDSMEQVYINQHNPDLVVMRRHYEEQVGSLQERHTQDQKRIERKLHSVMQEHLNDQEQSLKHKSDVDIRQSEETHEKKLKSNLKSFESELRYQNLDLVKKIEHKKKLMADSDRKQLHELEERRRRVKTQSEQEKSVMKDEASRKLSQLESEYATKLKQEKERFLRNLRDENSAQLNYLKQQCSDTQQEHEHVTRDIKDSFKVIRSTQQQSLLHAQKTKLEDYEAQERPKVDAELKAHQHRDIQRSSDLQEKAHLKDQHQQKLALDLKLHEQQVRKELEHQKDLLQAKKKARLQTMKDKYGGGGTDIDKEIDLFMQLDQTRVDTEVMKDEIRRLCKVRDAKKERVQELSQVCVRFDLTKEAQNAELIKYELEHKYFLVQKKQEKHDQKQREVEQLQKDIEALESRLQQQQAPPPNKQIDQMLQSVTQLIQQQQQAGESKLQQSMMVSQLDRSMLRNKSSIAPPTTTSTTKDHSQQFRQWQTQIVEERVKLNRQREQCRSQKLSLQASQSYLLNEQNQLKHEIQETSISYHQPNAIKKDLLRKMKLDIQGKLKHLANQIVNLNQKRNLLHQRDAALTQIEKVMDRKNEVPDVQHPQIISNLQSLYELYSNIGQELPESPDVVEHHESSGGEVTESIMHHPKDLKFHQDMEDLGDELNAPRNKIIVIAVAQLSQNRQPNNLQGAYEFDNKKDLKKISSDLRYQLVDHQDWLQKCKYQLSKNISRSPESLRQLNNYSSMLLNQY